MSNCAPAFTIVPGASFTRSPMANLDTALMLSPMPTFPCAFTNSWADAKEGMATHKIKKKVPVGGIKSVRT